MGHLDSVHASKRKIGESNYSYISERATKLIQIPRHKNPSSFFSLAKVCQKEKLNQDFENEVILEGFTCQYKYI
jgi:hypothetical protein